MSNVDSMLWPGPRPYKEDRAHLFFGRQTEVARMVAATFERMGILSADSGAGKTSLLAAGYIPELRKARAAGKNVPPVLFLREWANDSKGDADRRMCHAIRGAVTNLTSAHETWEAFSDRPDKERSKLKARAEAIAESVKNDAKVLQDKLGGISPEEKLLPLISALCDETGGLIIILDQVEELMGSASRERDPLTAEKAIDVIGRLYRDEPRVKILIALRSEYCRTLQRLLNRYVINLDRRIIDLEPLPIRSIREIVAGPAKHFGTKVEEGFLKKIESMWSEERGSEHSSSVVSFDSAELTEDDRGASAISLLGVQALLQGYEKWWSADMVGELVLSEEGLEKYSNTLAGADPLDRDSVQRWGYPALKKWVGDQLDLAMDIQLTGDTPGLDGIGPKLCRWILKPMLPQLSAQGGYKQHLPMLQLCLDLTNRLDPQGSKSRSVKNAVQDWMGKRNTDPIFEPNSFEFSISGPGMAIATLATADSKESNNAVIGQCLRALFSVLDSLEENGILKFSGEGSERSCELIHDGLSEYVRAWADQLDKKPDPALGSPVQIKGERFFWTSLPSTAAKPLQVHGVQWIGTSLVGAKIEHVRFRNCDLTGMYFRDCVFNDVDFTECTLAAAVFDICKLSNVKFNPSDLKSTAFKECEFGAEVLFSGTLPKIEETSTWVPGIDKDCNLTCVSFEGCKVDAVHGLAFHQCIMRFSLIKCFEVAGDVEADPKLTFIKCDLMNAWVQDAGLASVKVDEACRTIGLVSYTLPEHAWLDRKGEKMDRIRKRNNVDSSV